MFDAPAQAVVADVPEPPRLTDRLSGPKLPAAGRCAGAGKRLQPDIEPWPPAIRGIVLVSSVVAAWAVLAGVGYLTFAVMIWK